MHTAEARSKQCREFTVKILEISDNAATLCSRIAAMMHPDREDRCYRLVYLALVSGMHDITMSVDLSVNYGTAEDTAEHIAENYGGCNVMQRVVEKTMRSAFEAAAELDSACAA